MSRAQGRDDEAGGDEDEKGAGHPEEAAEIDAHAAGINAPADQRGRDEADDGAEGREARGIGRRKGGEQEDTGLETLPQDGEKGHGGKGKAARPPQCVCGLGLELALHVPRMGVHPQDHAGDEDHGERADQAFQPLLLGLWQRLFEARETHPDGDRQGDGEGDAHPHRLQIMAVLLQKGRDDPDDQSRFQAFAQANDQGCQHDVSRGELFEDKGARGQTGRGRVSQKDFAFRDEIGHSQSRFLVQPKPACRFAPTQAKRAPIILENRFISRRSALRGRNLKLS